jgi:hypothetical protein
MPLIAPRIGVLTALYRLWTTIRRMTALWWRRSVANEMISAIGFILYTLLVVNVYFLVQPAFRVLFGSQAHSPHHIAREQRCIPRWRRRRRDSLDRPPERDERELRRQLSLPGESESAIENLTAETAEAGYTSARLSKPSRPALSNRPSRISSQSDCLLLTRLPLELRQEIYRLVLTGRHKHFIRLGGDDYTIPSDFVLNDADYRTRDTMVLGAPPPRWLWPRYGSLLALPLTCRQVYIECVNILYQSVVFKVSRLFTLTDLSVALLPQRFATIRSLEISYEFRCGLPLMRGIMIGEDADWASCWRLMNSRMPGLRDLRMDLFAFDVQALVDDERDELLDPDASPRMWRWLGAMLQVDHLRRCVVKLHHVKRFNDSFAANPSVSWYMLVVMDALERVITAGMTGKALSENAPFGMPESEKLNALWWNCLGFSRHGRQLDRGNREGTGPTVIRRGTGV